MHRSKYTKKAPVNVEWNISDNGFTITDSKARIIYRDFVSVRRCVTLFFSSLSFFTTIGIALLTSDFKNSFGLESSVIKAIFIVFEIISALSSLGFGIACLVYLCMNRFKEEAFIKALHKYGKEEEDE